MKLFDFWDSRLNKEIEKEIKFDGNSKHSPMTYKIHDYLKENAVGFKNRIKSNEIMRVFGIKDNKTFRKYIEEIRQSSTLQKIVCSQAGNQGGYWIATSEEEVEETLNHLYKRAMEMLKTYAIIRHKYQLDGQHRIKMTKYEKDIIESIMR